MKNPIKRPRGRQKGTTDPLKTTTIRLTTEQAAFIKHKGANFVRELLNSEMAKAGFGSANNEK